MMALGHQSWSQTADVTKGVVAMQSLPEQSHSSYGFLNGFNLRGAEIMKNKLLAASFEDLEKMQFAHRFVNVSQYPALPSVSGTDVAFRACSCIRSVTVLLLDSSATFSPAGRS